VTLAAEVVHTAGLLIKIHLLLTAVKIASVAMAMRFWNLT